MSNLDPRRLDALPFGASVTVKLTLHDNGAMSIEGPIHDQAWMMAFLDNARDAVRNHHMPRSKSGLIIPDKDITLPGQTAKVVQ
jgi:hypothetical protein